jgi:hypothetical protein
MDMDIRYVAGLFDADGWITINKWSHPGRNYVRYQLIAGIGQVYLPLILKFKEQYGGDLNRNDSAQKRNPNCRICYMWKISSRGAAKFLADLEPWLIVKKPQALLAMEFQDHVTRHASDFKYRPHMRDELYAYREDVIARMKSFKAYSYDVPVRGDPIPA